MTLNHYLEQQWIEAVDLDISKNKSPWTKAIISIISLQVTLVLVMYLLLFSELQKTATFICRLGTALWWNKMQFKSTIGFEDKYSYPTPHIHQI